MKNPFLLRLSARRGSTRLPRRRKLMRCCMPWKGRKGEDGSCINSLIRPTVSISSTYSTFSHFRPLLNTVRSPSDFESAWCYLSDLKSLFLYIPHLLHQIVISFEGFVPVLRISEPCSVHNAVPYLKFIKSINVSL